MIGDRIKAARLALGYSAEQVAAFLGVSPATIYRYENGDISKLPSKHVKPLADFLCVSPSYLMGWSEDSPGDSVPLTADENQIISVYRSLPSSGKQYVHQQLIAAQLMFGEKSADTAASDVK